jgi:hypothetical protein
MRRVAKFAGKQFLPFSVREVPKLYQRGAGCEVAVCRSSASLRPGKDITFSPAELAASEMLHQQIPARRTQADVEKSKTISGLAAAFRAKQPDAFDAVRAAVKSGEIDPSDLASIQRHVKNSGLPGTVKSLDMPDAMDVWAKASPEERKMLGPTMFQKLRGTKKITREQRVAFNHILQRDWLEVKGGQ